MTNGGSNNNETKVKNAPYLAAEAKLVSSASLRNVICVIC